MMQYKLLETILFTVLFALVSCQLELEVDCFCEPSQYPQAPCHVQFDGTDFCFVNDGDWCPFGGLMYDAELCSNTIPSLRGTVTPEAETNEEEIEIIPSPSDLCSTGTCVVIGNNCNRCLCNMDGSVGECTDNECEDTLNWSCLLDTANNEEEEIEEEEEEEIEFVEPEEEEIEEEEIELNEEEAEEPVEEEEEEVEPSVLVPLGSFPLDDISVVERSRILKEKHEEDIEEVSKPADMPSTIRLRRGN
eukprot:TRINITY_DN774256_c0_g1_i1.p1 TRINITY_DN774256_c0_g1~~TRINITY_DN774256_c0_g1_i1.p1  ORF type:complete len:248 (-),score=74.65 TRINITY_DN774256_c0_g1_i1:274-1017(-)